MLKKICTVTFTLFSLNFINGQECPIINDNGSFEDLIYVLGGEANIGITTGQINNWSASHGTVDYVTEDWNYYNVDGVTSIAGHMCYGHRETHNHSEGMYTSAKIYGDDDLLYTLKLDYATVCDAENNGFLNVALNSKLYSEGHNNFQYPTAEAYPEVFQDIQAVDRMELMPSANMENGGYTKYEISFIPNSDYEQIWLFTEYQYEQEDFVNCGILIDDVELTAITTALTGIDVEERTFGDYDLTPEFSKSLDIVSYNWSVNHKPVIGHEMLTYDFALQNMYTICLDIIDSRGACGSTCVELDLRVAVEGESEAGCVYATCLDAGGIPNIVSFEYLSDSGQKVVLDKNSDGFFFPYCTSSEDACNGNAFEIELFIEDLNDYFNRNSIDANITYGADEDVFDSFCRSSSITIESSEIIPSTVLIDNFLYNEPMITTAEFQLDPSSCPSVITGKDDESNFTLVQDETEEEVDTEKLSYSITPKVYENQLIIDDENEEDIYSKVAIFSTSGRLVFSLDNYKRGDEINMEGLPIGIYAINIVNKQYQRTGFFFLGQQ